MVFHNYIRTTEPSCICGEDESDDSDMDSGYGLKRVVKLPGSTLIRNDQLKKKWQDGRAEMNERARVREYGNLWLKLST